MGLVGALVVLPSTPGSAYGTPATAYTDESVVLLTDVDPALAAAPATFDMRNYTPKVHLVNGSPFPATTTIPVTAATTALLRVVNAGIVQHSLGVLGTRQRAVATSGRPLSHPSGVAATNVSAGDTVDLVVDVPATGGPLYPVYDSSTRLDSALGSTTGVVPFGGALTFLSTGSGTPPVAGPSITGLAVASAVTGGSTPLGFTATAGAATEPAVTAVEYVIDNGSAPTGSGTTVSVTPGTGPVAVAGSIPVSTLGGLAAGPHTLLVRANSASGWGALAAVTFALDKLGPTSTLTVAPSATNGAALTISGSATDSVTGGSAVASATFSLDGGAPQPLDVTPSGAVSVTLSGTVPASALALPFPEGSHSITATATDAWGNVGATSTAATFIVDRTLPTVSAVTVSPSPNNGSQGTPADPTVVEVRAGFADPPGGGAASGVVAGEAFLGSVGATGSGFPMSLYPSSGPDQVLLGTFPVSELTRFGDGTVPVYVHAKDAAGNWGATLAGSLVISRDAIFASAFDSPTTLVPPWAGYTQGTGTNARLSGANVLVSGTDRAFVITRSVRDLQQRQLAGVPHRHHARGRAPVQRRLHPDARFAEDRHVRRERQDPEGLRGAYGRGAERPVGRLPRLRAPPSARSACRSRRPVACRRRRG